jgi:hypothetical protein
LDPNQDPGFFVNPDEDPDAGFHKTIGSLFSVANKDPGSSAFLPRDPE